MRKQIAAANWKMNCTYSEGERLLSDILDAEINLKDRQLAVFAVPFPYLIMANSAVSESPNYFIAAQNCSNKKSGAFTGEVSAAMLDSIGIRYCVIGHSERREYFQETNAMLAEKLNLCLANHITPIFCCGEALNVREQGTQNAYVEQQLAESLFHLTAEELSKVVIADEISILYGGSVKASNAVELFSCPDVDGGLVGGASLVASEFIQIIEALK